MKVKMRMQVSPAAHDRAQAQTKTVTFSPLRGGVFGDRKTQGELLSPAPQPTPAADDSTQVLYHGIPSAVSAAQVLPRTIPAADFAAQAPRIAGTFAGCPTQISRTTEARLC